MTKTKQALAVPLPKGTRRSVRADGRVGTSPTSARPRDPAVAFAPEVRIGPVAAIPEVLREFGISPNRPFKRSGVALSAFKDPESRIAFEALGRLLSECSTASGCEHFGLLVGERFEIAGLGAIGYLMRNSTTVGEALRALLLHLHLHDRGAAPLLIPLEESHVLLGYSIYRHGAPGTAHLYDAAIAIGHKALREICGPGWKAVRVQFSHARPRDPRPYRRVVGPNVQFDAEVSGIVFETSWLDHPITGADPQLRDLLMQAIGKMGADRSMSFADIVRRALPQMVLSGTSSAASLSMLFGIHERTLRKRLTAEGISFQQLLGQTRFELAKQLLENTELPLSDIALALRYADATVFSRAFSGWAKTSPRRWRARCKSGAGLRVAQAP